MISRIFKERHLRPYFANTSWLLADNVLRIFLGILVNTYVARYLGPFQFGKLTFALAIVAIFSILADMGLRLVVVRELLKEPEKRDEILASAFLLKICGGTIAALLSMTAIFFLRPLDESSRGIMGILTLMYIFSAFDVIELWFQSQVRAKYIVLARTAAFILISAIRILIIWIKAPLVIFASTYSLETILIATGLLWNYGKQEKKMFFLSFKKERAYELMGFSWPVLLAAFVIYFQVYIDQIMLGQIVGDAEVGQFSAAFNIIMTMDLVSLAVLNTISPMIMKGKLIDKDIYAGRLIKSYRIMFCLFLIIGIPLFVFGPAVVNILYGSAFHQAGIILSLLSIRILFFNFSAVKYQFLMVENLFLYCFCANIIGALIKVVLNFYLIAPFKSIGVICSMIAAYTVTVFIADIFHPRTRLNLGLMTKGITTFWKVWRD